jgi:hypothetical protein
MGLENICPVSPQRRPQSVDGLLDLPLRNLHRLVKAPDLRLDLLVRKEETDNAPPRIIDQEGPSDRDALTDADPLKTLLAMFFPRIAHRQTPTEPD